jgi:hypothetical protein
MINTTVRHILLLRLRPGASDEQISILAAALRGLAATIEGIVGFEYGANNSPEGKNLGMTHVVMLTFASAAARDAYLPHPAHRQAAARIGALDIIEELQVIDYTPQQ